MLYCVVLYCIVLHCIVLHCLVLSIVLHLYLHLYVHLHLYLYLYVHVHLYLHYILHAPIFCCPCFREVAPESWMHTHAHPQVAEAMDIKVRHSMLGQKGRMLP